MSVPVYFTPMRTAGKKSLAFSVTYRSAERTLTDEEVMKLSRAGFEPARRGGTAVSVKTVCVLARTTVRGKMPVTPKQSSAPRGPEVVRG